MNKKLLIVGIRQYRRENLIENVLRWGQRGVDCVVVPIDELQTVAWDTIGAVYLPLSRDLSFCKEVPETIPLILDYDGSNGGKLVGDEQLGIRRFAFRRAFGDHIRYKHSMAVPYIHLPMDEPLSDEKDVIIVDTHTWLATPWQFSLIALLAQLGMSYDSLVNAIGRPLRFYLTSFVPLKNYMTPVHAYLAQIPNAPQNSLEVIQANLIEPCANLKDYYKLLARTKVFITDHGDMADQDIINAGCAGTSICLISRNPLLTSLGITYSLHAAAQCVDARFYSFLQGTQKSLFRPSRSLTDFVKHTATPWDREFVSQLYFKIWDMLWQWAITGKEFPEVTEAVFKAPRWEV